MSIYYGKVKVSGEDVQKYEDYRDTFINDVEDVMKSIDLSGMIQDRINKNINGFVDTSYGDKYCYCGTVGQLSDIEGVCHKELTDLSFSLSASVNIRLLIKNISITRSGNPIIGINGHTDYEILLKKDEKIELFADNKDSVIQFYPISPNETILEQES